MPNIIFNAQLTGTSQVVNGISQINMAINGAASGFGVMGQRASAAGSILQVAFGYSAGRAIVGTFNSIAGGIREVGAAALDSIGHFQRLGGVIAVASAREMVDNSVIKEQIKTRGGLANLTKAERVEWEKLTSTYKSGSIRQLGIDLEQSQARLANALGAKSGAGKGLGISTAQQTLEQTKGALSAANAEYDRLLAKQALVGVSDKVIGYSTTLPQAIQASKGIQDAYLKRVQDLILHLPVGQDVYAQMLTTMTGYGVGTGNRLGIVETSTQVAEGLARFGIATGRTNDELQAMASAIGQVQAKGKVMAEEMTRQLNNAGFTISNVVRALQDAYPEMNITQTNFMAKMKSGEVDAKRFIEAIRMYLKQFEEPALLMKNTWAYLPQMLQNVRDTIIRVGFTGIFEQLQRPVVAFIDLFDPQKHPEALEGIKAIGDSIGEYIRPAMDWLTGPAISKLNQFIQGWTLGGNVWAAIANTMGLGIRTGMWQWDLGSLWAEIVRTKLDTPETQQAGHEAGQKIGHDIVGGIMDLMLTVPRLLAGAAGMKVPGDQGWASKLIGEAFQGTTEGLADRMSEMLGIPSEHTWSKAQEQWTTNWELFKQIADAARTWFIDRWTTGMGGWTTAWEALQAAPTATWNYITDTWNTNWAAIQKGLDDSLAGWTTAWDTLRDVTLDRLQPIIDSINLVLKGLSQVTGQDLGQIGTKKATGGPLNLPVGERWLGLGPVEPPRVTQGYMRPGITSEGAVNWGGPRPEGPPPATGMIYTLNPATGRYEWMWPLASGMRPGVGRMGPAEAPRSMMYGEPEYTGHNIFTPRTPTGYPDIYGGLGQYLSSPIAPTLPESGTAAVALAETTLPQIATQMQDIIGLLSTDAPKAADLFQTSLVDAATTTNSQLGTAQSILSQMATTGYPQLSTVAAAWGQAQNQATQAGITGNQALYQELTNLAGILQFLYQLMMGMPLTMPGLGGVPGYPGMGVPGGLPTGGKSGGQGARHLHFKTSAGKYENPLASGLSQAELRYWLGDEGYLSAMGNYGRQQQEAGLPWEGPTGSEDTAKAINRTGEESPKQTQYQKMLVALGIANNEQIAELVALQSGGDGGGGGGGGGKKKSSNRVGGGQLGPTGPGTVLSGSFGGVYANGTDFFTPAGSSNDRYPFVGLLSGREHVKITPYWKEAMGSVMISKTVNIDKVEVNTGMDLALFKNMLAQALAT